MKIEYFSGEIEAIGHVPNGQTLIINVETVVVRR